MSTTRELSEDEKKLAESEKITAILRENVAKEKARKEKEDKEI